MSVEGLGLGSGREANLIRGIVAAAGGGATEDTVVGVGDDAAVVSGNGHLVLSTDLSIEGIHFRADWLGPVEIGYRAAAAAISDLAAMAAEPVGVLLSLGIDQARAGVWSRAIGDGIGQALDYAGGALLGGDLSRIPKGAPIVIDIVAVGRVFEPVRRVGAQPGQEIWVTGSLGWPACAVASWEAEQEPPAAARQRFARPRPRIQEARWLVERVPVSAMIDVSDGLVTDVGHLASSSGVGVTLYAAALPVPTELVKSRGLKEASAFALSGGEEYELCFSGPPGDVEPFVQAFTSRFGVELTLIGEVTEGSDVNIVGAGVGDVRPGHDHFRDDSLA